METGNSHYATDGKSSKEIAVVMNISYDTVLSRVPVVTPSRFSDEGLQTCYAP